MLQDPTTWPVRLELPEIALVPVRHHTTQSDVVDSGFVLALDGRPEPSVFVGPLENLLGSVQEEGSRLFYSEPRELFHGLRMLTQAPSIDYESLEELLLDGWRPK
jgi:hypothetical protein